MPLLQRFVLSPGRLIGHGRDESCMVGANLSEQSGYTIQNLAADLPEGEYRLTFGKVTTAARKHDGRWTID